MACENNKYKCTCPHQCDSHGKCCECVHNHQEAGSLPLCFRREPFIPKDFAANMK